VAGHGHAEILGGFLGGLRRGEDLRQFETIGRHQRVELFDGVEFEDFL
jgi:hypothetical protein